MCLFTSLLSIMLLYVAHSNFNRTLCAHPLGQESTAAPSSRFCTHSLYNFPTLSPSPPTRYDTSATPVRAPHHHGRRATSPGGGCLAGVHVDVRQDAAQSEYPDPGHMSGRYAGVRLPLPGTAPDNQGRLLLSTGVLPLVRGGVQTDSRLCR